MQRSTAFYTLTLSLAMATASAVGQDNPGQMGTTTPPSATNPPQAQKPKPAAQPAPTTPTQPQPRQTTTADPSAATVDKPESAVGATATPRPAPPALAADPNAKAGALSPVQPKSDELRQKIESALKREPALSNATIVLNISDDAIDITGNANSPKERLAARRIVQSFAGNRRVRERINVAGITRKEDEALPTGTPQPPNGAKPADQPAPPSPDNKPVENKPKTDPEKHGDASDKPRI